MSRMIGFKTKIYAHVARLGTLRTRNGIVETPNFMPVVTKGGAAKIGPYDYHRLGSDGEDCQELNIQAVICNSLLTYFDPGIDQIIEANGIHDFLKYPGTIFSDSGGFQVSGLSPLRSSITDKGIHFHDPYTHRNVVISPRKCMLVQQAMGSDVAMVIDSMLLHGSPYDLSIQALERTHNWAKQCIYYHNDKQQLLFGICQGSDHLDLRITSAKYISNLGFDGTAIGGIAMLPDHATRVDIIRNITKHIRSNQLVYVMGIGSPLDILDMVRYGVDLFDAAYPTILGNIGQFISLHGIVDFSQTKKMFSDFDLECSCSCKVCSNYRLQDLLEGFAEDPSCYKELIGRHNLFFMNQFMANIREHIRRESFDEFAVRFKAEFV